MCIELMRTMNNEQQGKLNSTNLAPATRLTITLNADANMGHGFAIVMAHVGTLRPFGAPAPVNL